jgi:hypothetical protein
MAYPAPTEAVETRRKPDNTKHAIIPEIGPTCQRKPGVVTRRKEKRNQVLGTRNPGKEKDGTGNLEPGKRELRKPEPGKSDGNRRGKKRNRGLETRNLKPEV